MNQGFAKHRSDETAFLKEKFRLFMYSGGGGVRHIARKTCEVQISFEN
jgi:hypothetical protein